MTDKLSDWVLNDDQYRALQTHLATALAQLQTAREVIEGMHKDLNRYLQNNMVLVEPKRAHGNDVADKTAGWDAVQIPAWRVRQWLAQNAQPVTAGEGEDDAGR